MGSRLGVYHDSGHFYVEFTEQLERGNWECHVFQPKESKWVQPIDLHCGANLKRGMYKRIRDQVEIAYKTFKETGVRQKLTASDLRVMTVKALDEAWKDLLNQKTIVRSFERTGFSLAVDGSQDQSKMHFQGQPVGIPIGLNITNPI